MSNIRQDLARTTLGVICLFMLIAGSLWVLRPFLAATVWATMLGNLGGYIIVAKVVGLLAMIGVPTGGVAAVVTSIAAFGGPIVLGLALAILAAIAVFLFFWKSATRWSRFPTGPGRPEERERSP